ncbi:hypothetical protein GCM10025868_31860 [Angustibacter aerolatus]|uniref:Uncharacterized protein n=1 Tax=Angustibacter aerolatus TaxID=1162965 RepID=A0ABQ6JMI9_9ACTN|nr:hypothetical protein GCM10025868_31860 [Angustibacter aerolatus]
MPDCTALSFTSAAWPLATSFVLVLWPVPLVAPESAKPSVDEYDVVGG